MSLKNKHILITAGPTWVALDSVRIISNIATGETGILLAERLRKLEAKVTLLLGPVGNYCLDKRIKLINFKFFDELWSGVKKELKSKIYDIIIHSAAVADFRPVSFIEGKLASDKSYNLRLVPLPKIIREIRVLAPKAKLVMFKLEAGVSKDTLIQRAKIARQKAGADFIIANMLQPYCSFIINSKDKPVSVKNKKELVTQLTRLLVTSY